MLWHTLLSSFPAQDPSFTKYCLSLNFAVESFFNALQENKDFNSPLRFTSNERRIFTSHQLPVYLTRAPKRKAKNKHGESFIKCLLEIPYNIN